LLGFVELLEGGDCHDILLAEVVGSQHLIGDDGKHGGDETVASLEKSCVRKSFTMIFLIKHIFNHFFLRPLPKGTTLLSST